MGHCRTTSISLTRAMLTHLPCHRKSDPLRRKHGIRPTPAFSRFLPIRSLTLEGQLWVRSDPFAKPSRNGPYLRVPAGWNRRQADTAVRRPGRLNWADSVPPGAASGTTAVRAIAVVLLQV